MADPQKTLLESVPIRSVADLKKELGSDIGSLPEFGCVVTFTRQELTYFKNKLKDPRNKDSILAAIRVKIETAKKSTTEATGQSADMLRFRIKNDVEQSGKINSLDINKKIEDQRDKWVAFASSARLYMQHLLATGTKPEDMNSLSGFSTKLNQMPEKNNTEESLAKKVGELANNPNSLVATIYLSIFSSELEKAKQIAIHIRQVVENEQSGDSWKNPIDNPIVNPIVRFTKKYPLLAGGIALFGVWGITSMFSSKVQETNSKIYDWIPGWLKGIIVGAAGVWGVGKILGMDGTKKFLKDTCGIDVDNSRFLAVWAAASNFDMTELKAVLVHPQLGNVIREFDKLDVNMSDQEFDKWLEKQFEKYPALKSFGVGGILASSAAKKLWKGYKETKIGTKNPNEVPTGYVVPIAAARTYQFYHGAVRPWNSMKPTEKGILEGSGRRALTKIKGFFGGKTPEFKEAAIKLPEMQAEKIRLTTEGIDARATEVEGIFNSQGKHPDFGSFNDILQDADAVAKETCVGGKYKGQIIAPNTSASREFARDYARFVVEQDHAIRVSALENGIQAVEGGPGQYAAYMEDMNSPAKFIQRVHGIEEFRAETLAEMKRFGISPKNWAEFLESMEQTDKALIEKEVLAGGLIKKINSAHVEYGQPGVSAARKLELDGIVKGHVKDLDEIEKSAASMFAKTMDEHAEIAGILNKAGHDTKTSAKLGSWVDRFCTGNTHTTDLSKIRLRERRFNFRFGAGGTIALIGIGASTILSAAFSEKNKMWENIKTTFWRCIQGFIPIWGTYLDFSAAWNDFSQNNDNTGALANIGFGVASAISDVLLIASIFTGGISGVIGAEGKSWISGLKGAKSIKLLKESRDVAKTGKLVAEVDGVTQIIKLTEAEKVVLESTHNANAGRLMLAKVARGGMIAGVTTGLGLGIGVPLVTYAYNEVTKKMEQKQADTPVEGSDSTK